MVNPGNGPFVSCKWSCRWSLTLSSVLRSAGTSSTILKLFEKPSGLPVVSCGEWSLPVLKSAGTLSSTISRLLTHSVTSLTGSATNWFPWWISVSWWSAPCGLMGTCLGACCLISSFGYSWNSHGSSGDLSIPVVTTEYTLRMFCFFNESPWRWSL